MSDRRIIDSPYGHYLTLFGEKIPNGTLCEIIEWAGTLPIVRFDDGGTWPVPAHWLKKAHEPQTK